MSPPIAQAVESPVGTPFTIRSHQRVRLGPVSVDVRSNDEHFIGLRYVLPEPEEAGEKRAPDYIVSCCDLDLDGPWPLATLRQRRDRSYRAGRFSAGYYLTDHFGSPAYLLTEGKHHWIFASDFEPIFWPYAVKLLLSRHAAEQDLLHLKAAAIALNGAGTLLVGRGGAGKTVLLTQLCGSGAQFVTNTHVLIDGATLIGVPAPMRIRNDPLFAPIIAARRLPPGIKRDEYQADPIADLGWAGTPRVPVRNICLIDYRGPDRRTLEAIDRHTLLPYLTHFALALNVYGMKEDLLDFVGGDIAQFAAHVNRTMEQLSNLVARCNCYYVSCDTTDPRNVTAIRDLLEGSR